jgi:hypothetical protein
MHANGLKNPIRLRTCVEGVSGLATARKRLRASLLIGVHLR